jgi:hypothetical protein
MQGELSSCAIKPLPEDEWLMAHDRIYPEFPFHYPAEPDSEGIRRLREESERPAPKRKVATVTFSLDCRVAVPAGLSKAEALLLVWIPGRNYRPSTCSARLDGRPITLRQSDSSQHVGYFAASQENYWKDLLRHECEWCWYIFPVPEGSHQISYEGTAAHAGAKVGLWLWSEADLSARRVALDVACSEPAMPQYRAGVLRRGVCLKSV